MPKFMRRILFACVITTMLILLHIQSPTTLAANEQVKITGPSSGQPGTKVRIEGTSFKANTVVNLYAITDRNQCSDSGDGLTPITNTPPVSDGSGNFSVEVQWPANAGNQGTEYYVCATDKENNEASQEKFTVAQDVTVEVNPAKIEQGKKVTITGKNWVPAQNLEVTIAPKGQLTSPVIQQTPSNDNGDFSLDITVANSTQPGQYTVTVVASDNSNLRATTDLEVTAAPTPTPTATATPTPTPTPTAAATPTPTPTPTPTTTTTGSGTSPLSLVIYSLGGLGIVLLIIGIAMVIIYAKPG